MATTCKVYLSDALPIEVPDAHRAVYFPDGSVHILDKDERVVFIAAPGRFSAVMMGYAKNEDVDERQKVPGAMQKRPSAAIVPVVPIQPQPTRESPPQPTPPHWEKVDGPPQGFPPVGESKPGPMSTPGEVKITSLQDRGPDGETTHEMNIPIVKTAHQDFLQAPQTAGR
jgi:hypothetical protein